MSSVLRSSSLAVRAVAFERLLLEALEWRSATQRGRSKSTTEDRTAAQGVSRADESKIGCLPRSTGQVVACRRPVQHHRSGSKPGYMRGLFLPWWR